MVSYIFGVRSISPSSLLLLVQAERCFALKKSRAREKSMCNMMQYLTDVAR